jgi:Flp pilus assembly protein TadG
MIMIFTPLRKEKGSVLVLTALSLLVLMGMAALAIDLSHAYVNKTRLQNLADALALSAAISLNKQESGTLPCDTTKSSSDKEQYAEYYATYCTFPNFTAASGNAEVATAVANTNLAFTFSSTANLSSASTWWNNTSGLSTNGATFVRVVVSPMNIATWFARIMGFDNVAVSASAVAGFIPIAPCDITPFAICAGKSHSTGQFESNCQDNTDNPSALNSPYAATNPLNNNPDCYGYEMNTLYCLNNDISGSDYVLCPQPTGGSTGIGPGNFGFLDFTASLPSSFPNPALEYCAAGDPQCSLACKNPSLSLKTGANVGQVTTGFDTRFNEYPNSPGKLTSSTYKPDQVTGGASGDNKLANPELNNGNTNKGAPINGFIDYVQTLGSEIQLPTNISNVYSSYKNAYTPGAVPGVTAATIDSAAVANYGTYGRRLLAIPFVDCSNPVNGSGQLQAIGYGCFFMAREYDNTSVPYTYAYNSPSTKYLYGMFINDYACMGLGKVNSISNYGYFKVQLYKDPLSGHS